MDAIESGLQGLLPRSQWSRRGFVMTQLATGFALSVQPVSADPIDTDASGLEAGEVKVPVSDGSIPAYRAMPDKGGPCDLLIYPDAPHGFNADYRPTYRADAAKDRWAKMLAWFKDHGVA